MHITITIDASEAEAAALLDKLKEVFGEQVQVTVEADTPVAVNGTDAVEVPAEVSTTEPAGTDEPAPPSEPPGRGQIFRDPLLTGEHVWYGENLGGPKDWWIESHNGVSRPGGETQPVASELKTPNNSFAGYDRYLQADYGSTALEMGGSWRTFEWEFHQSDVAVREGFSYELTAVFHPIILNRMDDGSERFMSIEVAGDWMTNLEWRWVTRSLAGEVMSADQWRDGETLNTLTYELPFDQPHHYTWHWTCDHSEAVTFSLEFRNKWGLAMTKVWLHGATCVEE